MASQKLDMERLQYEQSLKQMRDNLNTLAFAENKGIEKGREKEKLEIIKNGLDAGFTLSQLSTLTKLSISQIEEIIEKQGWKIN